MNMDQPKYTFSETADYGGVNAHTLRGWDYRFNIFSKPRGAGKTTTATGKRGTPGVASLLTARSVYTVALTADITRYGLLPERAISLAKSFMHFSDDKDRLPGEIFPLPDLTVLAISPGIDWPAVLRLTPPNYAINMIYLLSSWGVNRRQKSVLAIDVTSIFQRVRDALPEGDN